MWRIELLGTLRVECGAKVFTRFQTRKNALLLGMLACEGTQVSRERLNAHLWPEAPVEDGSKSLRIALSWLRKNLKSEECADLLLVSRTAIQINSDAVVTDIQEFEAALAAARAEESLPKRQTHLERAERLYRGPFLTALDDYGEEPWVEPRRARFEALYLEVLQSLVEIHEKARRWRTALDYALRGAAIDPLSDFHRNAGLRLQLRTGDWKGTFGKYRSHMQLTNGAPVENLPPDLADLLPHLARLEQAGQSATDPELSGLERALRVSMALLSASDRRLLLSLSVFPAPFTAGEAVTILGEPSAPNALERLTKYALIVGPSHRAATTHQSEQAGPSELVYTLPETQRTLLWAQVAEGDRKRLQSRHADYWYQRAIHHAERFTQTGLLPPGSLLSQYLPNFDAAFAFLLAHDFDAAKALIEPIVGLYQSEGEWTRKWLDAVLRHPMLDATDWETLLLGQIALTQGVGTRESLHALRQRAQVIEAAITDASDDKPLLHLIKVLIELGLQAHHQEQDQLAEESLLKALALMRRDPSQLPPGSWVGEIHILEGLYDTRMVQGRVAEARQALEGAIAILTGKMAHPGAAPIASPVRTRLLYRYGGVLAIMGEFDNARSALTEALDGFSADKIPHGEADCMRALGSINLVQGRLVEARILIGQSVTYYANLGNAESRAAALGCLGDVYARQGVFDRAASCYEEGLAVWRDRGHLRWQAVFTARLAALACAQRDDSAPRLAEELRELCARTGSWKSQATAAQVEGDLARRLKQWNTAAEHYQQALRLHSGASHWLGMTELVEAFAVLALDAGRMEEASRLRRIADNERDLHGAPRPRGEYAARLEEIGSPIDVDGSAMPRGFGEAADSELRLESAVLTLLNEDWKR